MDSSRRLCSTLGLLTALLPVGLGAQAPEPVVHAVLFYSRTCPHCHELITQHLIPLQTQYGSRLKILGMETSQPWANNLYWEAIRFFSIPEDDWVVPILIVGQEVLVGGITIPDRFPGIIEAGLASGGIDLPDFPALVTFLREEDLLDPRYPDRLVARPNPAEQEPAPPSPEGTPPEGEAVTQAEGVIAPDSAGSEDPVAVVASPITDSASVAPGGALDTILVAGAPTAMETPGPSDSGAPGGRGGMRSSSGADSVTGAVGAGEAAVSPGLESAQSPVMREGRGGTLELEDAARGMESMTMWDRFNADPVANGLSVLVLLWILVSLGLRGYPPRVRGGEWPEWIVPALVVVGGGVAAYLSIVEVTRVEAVCGPVGDCNTVNQSDYARLFGVLPVGILGLVGYGVILALWMARRVGPKEARRPAALGLWGAAFLGALFSAYLTFLEPFVIGATCAWCLTSAVAMTFLLWAASPTAAAVWIATGSPAKGER